LPKSLGLAVCGTLASTSSSVTSSALRS
jgi:hypothetical protein